MLRENECSYLDEHLVGIPLSELPFVMVPLTVLSYPGQVYYLFPARTLTYILNYLENHV